MDMYLEIGHYFLFLISSDDKNASTRVSTEDVRAPMIIGCHYLSISLSKKQKS